VGDEPELQFAEGRRGRIAYQQWGDGVDVVGVPPLAQNIEAAWGWPDIVAMFGRFGQLGRYLHYDKRGTGASDRLRGVPDLEERVDDMRTVMDRAGVERAHLLGNFDGGATALLFAATHPERVRSIVLFGSGATTFPPEPAPAQSARFAVSSRAFARAWGTRLSPFVDTFAPSLARDRGFRRWHRRYERSCCDSETLLDLLQMSWETDVRGVCADVDAPVVLLHRRGDRIVDVARAHETAALLPDARVVEFPGDDHLGYAGDRDAWLDEMERWITGQVADRPNRAILHDIPRSRVITLGRFAVEVDGAEVPTSAWGSRHARTIVKRLAVARGWPVTRDELFELLWPGEVDRAKVGARLSVQLSTVRRVVPGGVLADRSTVRLDLDRVDLDLVDFMGAGDDAAVVAAHTGPFLPADDLPWAIATRTEVRARFAAAGVRATQAAVEAGWTGQAVGLARRLVDDDLHNLRGHELLVAALLDGDHHDAAVAAHAAWVTAGKALGVRVPPLDPV